MFHLEYQKQRKHLRLIIFITNIDLANINGPYNAGQFVVNSR